MFSVMFAELRAASETFRVISAVVAVCSSTAPTIVDDVIYVHDIKVLSTVSS